MKREFKGEVLQSESNEFADKQGSGEIVSVWKLAIAVNEERGMVFNISKNNPLYDFARDLVVGDLVRFQTEPEVKQDGSIKHKLVRVELEENED